MIMFAVWWFGVMRCVCAVVKCVYGFMFVLVIVVWVLGLRNCCSVFRVGRGYGLGFTVSDLGFRVYVLLCVLYVYVYGFVFRV